MGLIDRGAPGLYRGRRGTEGTSRTRPVPAPVRHPVGMPDDDSSTGATATYQMRLSLSVLGHLG